MSYLVIKALHLIGVVTWFAGLFYIFRLYVYHVENQDKPEVVKVLQIMERRLYYAITYPAMVLTVLMGITMVYMFPDIFSQNWFLLKITLLPILFGYHFFAGHTRSEFLKGNYFLTSRQCRFINEVPTIILLIVVPLAVIKPW